MFNAYMNEQDVPSAKEAEAFVTVGEQRYNLLNAKNFEGKANISTKEIPVLGKIISGRKPTGSVRTRKPVFPPEITDLPGSNRMNLKKPVPQTPSQGKKRRRTCTGKRRKPCVTI